MKLDKQVNSTCKSAWCNLFRISKIKKFLSTSQLKSVIQAFVISKIDQNNALLIGSPKCLTSKLQSVQNAACKLVCNIRRFDHVEPPLADLHWLPVEQRIQFKVLLLCYKSLNSDGPAYLKELLIPYCPPRALRSGYSNLLVVPKTIMRSYGDRAFSVAGPRMWNKLPSSVKDCSSIDAFKRNLKTLLFKDAFY